MGSETDSGTREGVVGQVMSAPAVVAWWSPSGVRFIQISSPIYVEDVANVIEIMRVGVGADVPLHTSLIDIRNLNEAPLYMAELAKWALENRSSMANTVTKAAVVYTHFASAGLVAAHHHMAKAPYPTEEFKHGPDALRWLECASPDEVWQQWEEILQQHEDRIDRRLRHYLDANLQLATLEHCAESLNISSRSLQRHLQQQSISFRDLLTDVRVQKAKTMLRTIDKITAVAAAVGFSRPEQLNKLLLAHTGKSAQDWRNEWESAEKHG